MIYIAMGIGISLGIILGFKLKNEPCEDCKEVKKCNGCIYN